LTGVTLESINKRIVPSKKKLIIGTTIVGVFCFIVIFADFLAPYDYREQSRSEPSTPPSVLRFRDEQGKLHFRPFIYESRLEDSLTLQYAEDTSRVFPVALFVRGHSYRFLGLFQTDLHFFGTEGSSMSSPRMRLLGTDALGRDRFSRLLEATRFSLIVSPIGTFLACAFGILLGLISGNSSRLVDTVLMGVADAMISLPTLIIILAARAAFPLELPPLMAALLLVMIFALTGWAEISRLSRGLVREMRHREFVLAARASGLTEMRILFRHILPNISRQLFAQAALILPLFLLAEVSLSFLGVGLQEPEPSLGNMLTSAGDISQLASHPFLLLSPALAIFLFTVGVKLVGDGLKSSRFDGGQR
jgi:peptide/nickel transport system permease protein